MLLWAATALVLLASVGQTPLRITGRTLSDTAAPIAGAEIALRKPGADAVVAHATSDAAGSFSLEVGEPGSYVLTAAHEGFFTLERLAVTVAADTSLSL